MHKDISKRAYLRRRMAAVRDLYLKEGHEPADIARKLVENGTIETTDESLESAIRLVRGDVAKIRAELDGHRSADADKKTAITHLDILKRALDRIRKSHKRLIEISHDDTFITVTTVTPNGDMVSQKPRTARGVQEKAAKDAETVALHMAELEMKIAEKLSSETEQESTHAEGGLTIIESDKSIEELITANLRVN